MSDQFLRMPSMKSLQVFECVARTRSFKDAAVELFVTPAAVSFQIRQLEKDLKTQLFERTPTGVVPTAAGDAFIPKLTAGIETLHQAFQDFLTNVDETPHPIRVTSGPAVMSKWLVPEVRKLKKENNALEIEFSAGLSFVDMIRDNIDFAIRFGSKPDDRYTTYEIAEEYLVPAISPDLADELTSCDDIDNFDLIHDKSLHVFDETAPSWETWFQMAGLPYNAQRHGISFSQSDHAIQAAASGAGIGLVRVILAGPELLSGRLQVPFGPAIPTGLRYYLLAQKTEPENEEEAQVKDWLIEDIAGRYRQLIKSAKQLHQSDSSANISHNCFQANISA